MATDKAKVEHRVIPDDELFYDPDMDDADQRWVDAHRARCRPPPPRVTSSVASTATAAGGASTAGGTSTAGGASTTGGASTAASGGASSRKRRRADQQLSKPANSDAVLNCPACMSVLSRDCQRYAAQ